MRAHQVSPALRAAAIGLRVDAVTADIVGRLREAGVRSILLKGPSIAAWLYADGGFRAYGDTDLLIAPDSVQPASGVMRKAGFREQPGVSSRTWFRRTDGSIVDLHDTLFGAEASPEAVWAALSERTGTMRVGGLEVEVLAPPCLALNVALHAAQHAADGFQRPALDLERAISLAGRDCWEEAGRLAERLGATGMFAAGLRLHADGAKLAESMGLPAGRPVALSLRAGNRPFVVTLERLAATRGAAPRLRLLARRLAPPPDYMRSRYPSLAARGWAGLALAYLWRPVSIAPRLPAALASWRRTRRASG